MDARVQPLCEAFELQNAHGPDLLLNAGDESPMQIGTLGELLLSET